MTPLPIRFVKNPDVVDIADRRPVVVHLLHRHLSVHLTAEGIIFDQWADDHSTVINSTAHFYEDLCPTPPI